MKIAIISDVHGNLEALKTVLSDIKNRGITEIYCLGDMVHKGTHQKECLKLIKENCKVILKGNCDDYFTKEHDLNSVESEIGKKRIIWNSSMLDEEEKQYLQSLPLCYEFYLSGRLVRLFHAGPNSCYDTFGLFASINEKYSMFLPSDYTNSQKVADIVVYGHIHTQMLNMEYNKTLLNCGSVGNSLDYIRNSEKDGNVLNTTNAQYLILEGELDSTNYSAINFQFVRVPYDIEKELENNINNPEKDAYNYELTQGKYRDMNKVYNIFKSDGINTDEI